MSVLVQPLFAPGAFLIYDLIAIIRCACHQKYNVVFELYLNCFNFFKSEPAIQKYFFEFMNWHKPKS